jgi:hypothetical protein
MDNPTHPPPARRLEVSRVGMIMAVSDIDPDRNLIELEEPA